MGQAIVASIIALGAVGYCLARFQRGRRHRGEAGCPGCRNCGQAPRPGGSK